MLCYYCGQAGHIARVCLAKKPLQEHTTKMAMERMRLESVREQPKEEETVGPSRVAIAEESQGAFAMIPEEQEEAAKMGTKRVKGQQGGAKRYRAQPVLMPTWKHHIEEN